MSPRLVLLLAATMTILFAVGSTGGCLQSLDSNAASGDDGGENADALSTWQLCASPSCDLPTGEIPFLDQTPPIYLADAATTVDPCVQIEQASIAVRQTYCASCHEAPASQGNLGSILEDTRLLAATAGGQPLLVPGAPLKSAIYTSVALGIRSPDAGMPPPALAGHPSIPRPTASDLSVLYAWIAACLPGTDAGAYDMTIGSYPVSAATPDAGED
jgi:hypothetical protein